MKGGTGKNKNGKLSPLVIKNAQVARNDLVFQNSAGWDVNTVTVVGDNDNRSLGTNVKNLKYKKDENSDDSRP